MGLVPFKIIIVIEGKMFLVRLQVGPVLNLKRKEDLSLNL